MRLQREIGHVALRGAQPAALQADHEAALRKAVVVGAEVRSVIQPLQRHCPADDVDERGTGMVSKNGEGDPRAVGARAEAQLRLHGAPILHLRRAPRRRTSRLEPLPHASVPLAHTAPGGTPMTTETTPRAPATNKPRSWQVTEGAERAPNRSYFYAMGLTDEDLARPIVAVGHAGNEAMPCNIHLGALAQHVKQGVREAGGTPREFATIAVGDGMAMGHEGMKASLVSREIIADSAEVMMLAHAYDGMAGIAGCDKSLPGMIMAIARVNLPSIFLYGGSIMPGRYHGHDVTVQDVFEGVGAHSAGNMSDADLLELEHVACPGAGSCGGMFTANTMACVSEALGIALPGSAAVPAIDPARADVCRRTGEAVLDLLQLDIRPRDILTREALENGMAVAVAVGGSTNAVLHLLAIAREAEVPLTIDDLAP